MHSPTGTLATAGSAILAKTGAHPNAVTENRAEAPATAHLAITVRAATRESTVHAVSRACNHATQDSPEAILWHEEAEASEAAPPHGAAVAEEDADDTHWEQHDGKGTASAVPFQRSTKMRALARRGGTSQERSNHL